MAALFAFTILLFACAVFMWRVARIEYRTDRIPVLNYHRIVSNENLALCKKNAYIISESAFREQLQFLKDNGYTTIDLDDFLYYKAHRNELPPKSLIITFDDGYENNYLYAYPILKNFKYKAVIYSVSDPNTDFFNSFEIPERLLSPEQMRELSNNGISIQSHTKTHPHLKYLSNDLIKAELKDCKDTLEAITQRPVIHMAIPYGSYDRRLFRIAQEVGYKTLEIPGRGTINLDTDPYRLRRIAIHSNTTIAELQKIVSSPFFAIVNRLYAATHLAVRRMMGQSIEEKLKRIFAQLGLDNPVRFAKFAIGVLIVALILYVFIL
jgi:peptidoglycan/xylan/chitin deacetylase (PgdA/CDA1 family)